MIAALTVIVLVLMGVCGGLVAAAYVYRRRVIKLRALTRQLRAELEASKDWNGELRAARQTVDEILAADPMHRERQALEELWRTPARVPEHEKPGGPR